MIARLPLKIRVEEYTEEQLASSLRINLDAVAQMANEFLKRGYKVLFANGGMDYVAVDKPSPAQLSKYEYKPGNVSIQKILQL